MYDANDEGDFNVVCNSSYFFMITCCGKMPFFGRKENVNVDYKARLEHKLYLARENPEPVFDLSDCALKNVPAGVFSLCKVFRKESLHLQENQLTSLASGGRLADLSLLQTLDLHSNCLLKLPDEIGFLTNLRDLNVSANKLTQLPESVGRLAKLQSLDVSSNSLKQLPQSLGQLQQLRHLDVRLNRKLTALPATLCHASQLEDIRLDSEAFQLPPRKVASQGTQAIMRFLCAACGVEYAPPTHDIDTSTEPTANNDILSQFEKKDNEFQAKILQLEALKEQKQQERLRLEQELVEQQRRELELQTASKGCKGKLLEELAHQQQQLEGDILRLQEDRQHERQRLLQQIQQVEQAADSMVSQLLAQAHDTSFLQGLVEREGQEEQRLLATCHDESQALRRRDVLNAMESLLQEEAQRAAKLREYEKGREESTRSLLSQELEHERQLADMLQRSGAAREGLASQLHQDEQLQRAAVGALLERSDARSWGLVQHLRLVQEQLAALTALEVKRRELHLNEQMEDLGEKRAALSALLVQLLAQQATRRRQLLDTLHALEERRQSDTLPAAAVSDFWLRQYQRLLDSTGGGGAALAEMERALDPALATRLLGAGVLHCLPLLARWLLQPADTLPDALAALTERDLARVGVTSADTREAILKAVGLYLEERRQRELKMPPEAELTPAASPSAPEDSDLTLIGSLGASECVVCMDSQCEVIFVPCGHLCCCPKCSEALSQCPMCRASVEQKIRVLLP